MRLLVAGLVLFVLSACGPSSGVAPYAPPSQVTPARGFDVLITDHDRDVTVLRGQKVEVALTQRSGMSAWGQITAQDPGVLAPVPTGITAPRGVTIAGFVARGAGTTEVTATAGPQCAPNQACPAYAMLFQVRVTVS